MPRPVSIDVIDHPSGGALAALLRLQRSMGRSPPAGCLGMVPCTTGHFAHSPVPRPTPRRVALIAAWSDTDALERAEREGLPAALSAGAREHWHVRGEVARAVHNAPWGTWVPDAGDARPPAGDEPLLVLISGELRARHLPAFVAGSARAYRQARTHPGYLGGLALQSSPLNTTSCSAWRTAADSRAFAFGAGDHATAMKRDRVGEHHRTERFIRIRPQYSRGTLGGRDPFAGVLTAAAAA